MLQVLTSTTEQLAIEWGKARTENKVLLSPSYVCTLFSIAPNYGAHCRDS